MMLSDRKKQRFAHVRTGCLTCKHRKLKCPEERPRCSRCISSGLVCDGYAPPKTWLFESSAVTSAQVNKVDLLTSAAAASKSAVSSPRQGADQNIAASPLSPLNLGNSDPFNAYSIRLGPHETSLLRIKHSATVQSHPPHATVYQKWMDIPTTELFSRYAAYLEHEMTAYGLLARIAAQTLLLPKVDVPILSTSVLKYMARSQAALRKELLIMGSSSASSTLKNIMLTASFLADAELSLGSPTVDLHIRAMTDIVGRYLVAEMAGTTSDFNSVLYLMYLDIITAVVAFRRCHLDTTVWLPRFLEGAWMAVGVFPSIRANFRSRHTIHHCIKDTELRNVMLSQKSRHQVYDSFQAVTAPVDMRPLCDAIRIEDVTHYDQLLNVAVDARYMLEKPGLTLQQVQDQYARIYLSIAVRLWIRLTSPTEIANNTFLDIAPNQLRHLKTAISKSVSEARIHRIRGDNYAAAKLWALSIGVYTESQCKETIGADPVCGTWFYETFHQQAAFMRILSWRGAVVVFEDFLGCDYVKPHISDWWPSVLKIG